MKKPKIIRFEQSTIDMALKVMEKEDRSFNKLAEIALRTYVEKALKKFKGN